MNGTPIEARAGKKGYREKRDPPQAGEGSRRGDKALKRDRFESRT